MISHIILANEARTSAPGEADNILSLPSADLHASKQLRKKSGFKSRQSASTSHLEQIEYSSTSTERFTPSFSNQLRCFCLVLRPNFISDSQMSTVHKATGEQITQHAMRARTNNSARTCSNESRKVHANAVIDLFCLLFTPYSPVCSHSSFCDSSSPKFTRTIQSRSIVGRCRLMCQLSEISYARIP